MKRTELNTKGNSSNPQLVLIGNSPDLQVLAKLGQIVNFQIAVLDPETDQGIFPGTVRTFSDLDFSQTKNANQTYIIVATHGRYDEEALEKCLATQAVYIGFIASKKRAVAIFEYLKTKGITEKDWERVKSPAGIDIGAKTPDEIALSILAEIVEIRQKILLETVEPEEELRETPEESIDPICGMTVNVNTARYKTEFKSTYYYFCCAGCLQKFEQEPEKYIQQKLA